MMTMQPIRVRALQRTQAKASAVLVVTAVAMPCWGADPVPHAGSVDAGRAVFPLCQSCHVDPPTAQRFASYRFNAAGLTAAFQRIPEMQSNLALGAQTINDIASYLGLPEDTSNDTDRLLDWAEDTYPQLLSPRRQVTGQLQGYTYRFYPSTGIYAGSKDGFAWFYDSRTPGAAILNLGTLRSFLDQMPNGR